MRNIACALAGFILMALPAGAWNSLGHRAVAEVAWREMDPEQRKAVTDLLKQHPHYNELLAANVPEGVSTDEWAFLTGAIWPDLIRPAGTGDKARPEFITKYNVYSHAILLPVVRTSDAREISLANFEVETPNAETGLRESMAVLRNKNASAHDRAVALTWILHLCGDIHQPLHASTLVTKNKPKGNGAGGVFSVLDSRGREAKLHSCWDGLPGKDGSYQGICELADALVKLRPEKMVEYRVNKTVMSWAEEGRKVAADFAYAEEHVDFVLGADVASGKIARSDIPKISRQYMTEAERITRKRLALAALRLSDFMKEVF
jgi:hypothetical protein